MALFTMNKFYLKSELNKQVLELNSGEQGLINKYKDVGSMTKKNLKIISESFHSLNKDKDTPCGDIFSAWRRRPALSYPATHLACLLLGC